VKPYLFLISIFFFLPLTGCGNLLYLSKLGWHQSYITFHSVPVQEVFEDQSIGDLPKDKIRFIQEVKRYGEQRLNLRKTKSYTKYFEIQGSLLHVVTASQKDRLQLHHWRFPIIGEVTYKSFFTEEGVLKEKRSLEARDLDIFIQQAGAYSTLGWLKDPIFSSMLKWDESTLANLILHEMTHTTIYFKGETDFNEQMATFIGNQGAIDFLKEKYGAQSKEGMEAIQSQKDDLLFASWVDRACRRLSNFYEQPIARDEKIKRREEVFQSIKEEFKDVKSRFQTDCYKEFEKTELNNAVLLAFRRYVHNLDRFEALYESFGRDLRKVVEFFKEVRASNERPASFLERWMKERGIHVKKEKE